MKTGRANIFLTGARGSGKTTIGKLLSADLGLDFLDMDGIIEKQDGRTIREMVQSEGWQYFRRQEKELLADLCHRQNLVVATGGGAILHETIWPRIMAQNFVVWLKAEAATIEARLQSDPATLEQRPALLGEDAISEATKIMAQREPLYRKNCHLQVDTAQAAATITSLIIEKYKEKSWQEAHLAKPFA